MISGVPVLVATADEAEAVDLVHPGRLGEVVRRSAAELHVGLEGSVDADERGGGCLLGEIHAGDRDHDVTAENAGDDSGGAAAAAADSPNPASGSVWP